jgi:RNA polymerase sigma factor (sigma-70 family)
VPFSTIAALRSGDPIIFKEVFHQYYETIYHYVLKHTGAEFIADEATQLTFIKLWQHKGSLDEDLDLHIQLFRISRTTLIDLIRKQNTERIRLAEENLDKAANSDNVWETVTLHDLQGRLILNLEAMPVVRRKVFAMSRLYFMSNKEIASSLSISVKAVEFHITHAIRNLRKKL